MFPWTVYLACLWWMSWESLSSSAGAALPKPSGSSTRARVRPGPMRSWVVRRSLVEQAVQRFQPTWGAVETIAPCSSGREAVLGELGVVG